MDEITIGMVIGMMILLVLFLLWNVSSRKQATGFNWSVSPPVNKNGTAKKHMLELKITNEQKIKVAINPKTLTDKPAEIDGRATFTVISGQATIGDALNEDGTINMKGAFLISGDEPGDSEILVEADADLGEGVETISDIIKLTVLGARAASLGLTAEAAVAK